MTFKEEKDRATANLSGPGQERRMAMESERQAILKDDALLKGIN